MFRGSSHHKLDAKGRIIIPARFRDLLHGAGTDTLMLSQMDGALVGYPLDEWQKIESRILALAEKSDAMRRFRRVFIGGAFECSFDRQDRILIPPTLRQIAELNRHIVLVGVLDHFEIWSKEKWEQENRDMEADLQREDVRNEIARLGL